MSVISILIGIVICGFGIMEDPEYVFQQTAQICVLILGSIFICTGFILIGLKSIENRITNLTTYQENLDVPVWICEKCESENTEDVCIKCGASKSKILV